MLGLAAGSSTDGPELRKNLARSLVFWRKPSTLAVVASFAPELRGSIFGLRFLSDGRFFLSFRSFPGFDVTISSDLLRWNPDLSAKSRIRGRALSGEVAPLRADEIALCGIESSLSVTASTLRPKWFDGGICNGVLAGPFLRMVDSSIDGLALRACRGELRSVEPERWDCADNARSWLAGDLGGTSGPRSSIRAKSSGMISNLDCAFSSGGLLWSGSSCRAAATALTEDDTPSPRRIDVCDGASRPDAGVGDIARALCSTR